MKSLGAWAPAWTFCGCRRSDTENALSFLPWALARLSVAEPEVIHAALVEAMPPLGALLQAPWELSMRWWSSSMLGIENPIFLTELSRHGPLQKSNYNLKELEWLARSAATLNSGLDFSCAIQAKMVANILQNSARLGLSACAEDLQAAQAVMGTSSPNFLTELSRQGLLQKSKTHLEELEWMAWSAGH